MKVEAIQEEQDKIGYKGPQLIIDKYGNILLTDNEYNLNHMFDKDRGIVLVSKDMNVAVGEFANYKSEDFKLFRGKLVLSND